MSFFSVQIIGHYVILQCLEIEISIDNNKLTSYSISKCNIQSTHYILDMMSSITLARSIVVVFDLCVVIFMLIYLNPSALREKKK